MEVTESGIVTDVKELQPENPYEPMEVTESGIITDVKELQPENAFEPMEETELPSVMSLICE